MSAEQAHEWEPGDPLYPKGSYRDYLFNFRADAMGAEPGADAASWPEPGVAHRMLVDGDEIGDLIAWHRAQREAS